MAQAPVSGSVLTLHHCKVKHPAAAVVSLFLRQPMPDKEMSY